MQLITIQQSRLSVLVRPVRQQGELYIPDAVRKLIDRYSFASYPENFEQQVANTVEFRHGLFMEVAIDCTIFQDGILISSKSNTNKMDEFFEDFQRFLGSEFGVKLSKTHNTNKMYESGITVFSEKELLKPLEVFRNFSNKVSAKLMATSQLELQFEPFGFSVAPDLTKVPGLKPTSFRLERQLGVGFSNNEYFSVAPLRTDDHLELLENIEISV